MAHILTRQNIFLRQRAAAYSRRHFWRLTGLILLSFAVTEVLQTILTWLGDLVMAREIEAFTAAFSQYAAAQTFSSSQALLDAMSTLLASPKYLLVNLVYLLLLWFVSCGMMLGHQRELLNTGLGGTPRVRGLFSQMRYGFKALLLMLWTGLKTFFWMLPGLSVVLIGTIILAASGESGSSLVILAGMTLVYALMIPAMLRYALSATILAEDPSRGVNACVSESKHLMQGHKWQYFKLGVPCILKMLGAFLGVCVAGALVLVAAGLENNDLALNIVTLLSLLALLIFMPQLNLVYAMFYLLVSDIAKKASLPQSSEPSAEASVPADNDAPEPAPADEPPAPAE